MKIFFLFALLVFVVFKSQGQEIVNDPKGNYIFGVPQVKIQSQISSNNIGVSVPLRRFYKKLYYVIDDNNDKVYTMAKSKLLFVKANVVNNSKSTLLFDSKTNVSPALELGLSWGFDSLMCPSIKSGTYKTYSISAFAEYQNFNYYNTTTKSFYERKTNRISPGIKGNFTFFKGTTFAISFSGLYQNSIVTDKLTSYQKRANSFYFDDNIAANGTNEGYISPVEPTQNLRLSVATPVFMISGSDNDRLPFAFVPYYYCLLTSGEDLHNAGIILSFIGKRFREFDRNSNGSIKKDARYEFAQALNIGYNIIGAGSKDPNYFFVSGTFNLSNVKAKPKVIKPESTE
ncbi:hypothetical protein [Hymenobacter daeguensis]